MVSARAIEHPQMMRLDARMIERDEPPADDRVRVVADRILPCSCCPLCLKADQRFLKREGGALVYLEIGDVRTVAQRLGDHGW